jgi:Leucine-rich repeat (LRR) protein
MAGWETALSALPKVNPADDEKIRTFLPGKLLSRTAALLSLLLLVLGLASLFKLAWVAGLNLPSMSQWQIGALIAAAATIVSVQIFVEWRATQRRNLATELSLQVSSVPTGYFRIGPYLDTEVDRAAFHRADGAAETVQRWLHETHAAPLYLTGDSGSGKSSLLACSVIPILRREGWVVAMARSNSDPRAAIVSALHATAHGRSSFADTSISLRRYLSDAIGRIGASTLVVVDQFEEFLIVGSEEAKKEFAAAIHELHVSPIHGLSLLFVLRSDYQTTLDDAGLPALRFGENWFQVGRFTRAAAAAFMAKSKLGLASSALNQLLDSACEMDESPGMVRPVTLNVIGHVLSAGTDSAASLDAAKLVRDYVETATSQPAIRDFSRPVLEQMITSQGTKRARDEEGIVRASRLRPAEVRAVLNGLANAGLARRMDKTQHVWELSHDFVARAVSIFLGRARNSPRRLAAYYAAPGLFVLFVALGMGGLQLHKLADKQKQSEQAIAQLTATNVSQANTLRVDHPEADQARLLRQLADLGFNQTRTRESLDLVTNDTMTEAQFAHSARLFADLKAPIGAFSTSAWIYDFRPLAGGDGLSHLTRLELLEPKPDPRADSGDKPRRTRQPTPRQYRGDVPHAGLPAGSCASIFEAQQGNVPLCKDGDVRTKSGTPFETRYADIGALARFVSLKSLVIEKTRIRNLAPLRGLKDLTTARIVNSDDLEDIGGLADKPKLTNLTVSGSRQLQDIGALADALSLQTLDLSYDAISDLRPLLRLIQMRSLDLSGNSALQDLSPLAGLTNLASLTLSNDTSVSDLPSFSNLKALRMLVLKGMNKLHDLGPLRGLSLSTLDLSGDSRVTDISPLAGMGTLSNLDISGTGITDVSALKGINTLYVTTDCGHVNDFNGQIRRLGNTSIHFSGSSSCQ